MTAPRAAGNEPARESSRAAVRKLDLADGGAAVTAGHTHTGPRCRSSEVLPPVHGYGVTTGIDSVVIAELSLRCVRHQLKDAHVAVGRDRTPRGSKTGIEAATAGGTGRGRSPS
jgi:hypothetical protein